MKRAYIVKNFRADTLEFIAWINEVIEEYAEQGFSLTVRQLHYQLNANDPKRYPNTPQSYSRLGSVISDGRLAGLIDWDAIEDRGRNLMGHRTQPSPLAALNETKELYKRDLWEGQPCRPEVWIEKQALEGVIGRICDELRVDFFATRGHNSQSEQWRAGRRFAARYQKGQRPIVLNLGDHDPSGIDITRDNRERLKLFCGVDVHVIRLALNMEQIEELNPPSNYAKETDSRFQSYADTYFPDEPIENVMSWELDALKPTYIHNLIRDAVARFRDEGLWETALAQENRDRETLDRVIERL